MKILSHLKLAALIAMTVFGVLTSFAWADPPTRFTNTGSIANTRHNMTQSTASGGIATRMDDRRNDYGEVCVYCHTPHGSQTLAQMPLWNRTITSTTYTTYNQLGTSTLNGIVSQPGSNSRMCLTCHDGQTAIDSIINMPGSGNGLASQATTQDFAFLGTWINPNGSSPITHMSLDNSVVNGMGCVLCHNPANVNYPDFTLFVIGTDLTNDHPVGITYPAASGVGSGFNLTTGAKGTTLYFDADANGKMDKGDVRLYNTGGAVKVECATCHDPHGVPTAGTGSVFKPTFLRVDNSGSALCLTCHDK